MTPEAEQEVDLARYGRLIAARWWLLLGGLVVGALVGALGALGGGRLFQAEATVYLGQPLSPSGGTQIQSLATNPSTVSQIVKSRSVVKQVATELGVQPGKLRRGVATKTVAGAITRQGQAPLVEIVVRGPWREQTKEAANRLATIVVEKVSGYVLVKIDSLKELLAGQDRELAAIDRSIEEIDREVRAGGLSELERLLLVLEASNSEQRRGQLLEQQTTTRQLLTLAENVERSQVVTEATSTRVDARGKRGSAVVGALLGLLLGGALALVWDPLLAGRRRRHA